MIPEKVTTGRPATYGMPTQSGKLARKNARSNHDKKLIVEREQKLKEAVRLKKSQRKKLHVSQQSKKVKS